MAKSLSISPEFIRNIYLRSLIRLKQFYEAHNVQVYFYEESLESSTALLVYDPLSAKASLSHDEKKKHLDAVEKDILKSARAADVKTETISVEKRRHDAVAGKLNE